MKYRLAYTLLFLFIFSVSVSQEVVHTRLPFIAVCPGTMAVQVQTENCAGISSISLSFSYDSNSLDYLGCQNINTALNSGTYVINANDGHILFAWFSINPVTIGNGLLFDVLFSSHASTSSILSWDTTNSECSYTDINGLEIESVFHDGFVFDLLDKPALLSPLNYSSGLPIQNTFNWTPCECGCQYEFQLSKDSLFQQAGIQVQGLTITSHTVSNLDYNSSYFWRVRSGNQVDTSSWSDTYRFKTKLPDAIEEISQSVPIGIQNLAAIQGNQVINFTVNSQISVDITVCLYELTGRSIKTAEFQGIKPGETNLLITTGKLSTGIHCIVFEINNIEYKSRISKKINIINP